MRASAGLLAAAFLLAAPAFSQDEDLLNPPDAPMRSAEKKNLTCTLEGVQVLKKENDGGAQDVNIVFLLTEKPTAYFDYYDADKKAVVFDFYDTHIGESLLDTIRESPITFSTVEPSQVDLNRDVAGLKPDIRDIVRVSLFTPQDFEYDVREEDNVITLSFDRSSHPVNRPPLVRMASWRAFYWQFPVALLTVGGVGFVTYEMLKKSSSPSIQAPCCPERPLR